MKPTLISSCVLALTVAGLNAQVVSPAENAVGEGSNRIYRPFGGSSTGGWRYMQIHDDLKGKKVTVNSVAFRRDGATTTNYMSFSVTVTMLMSTAKNDSQKMVSRFDDNHGGNKQTVITNKKFDFPTTIGGHIPAAWSYSMKLDRPYSFDGTNGGLCWEARTTLHTNLRTTVYFDAAWSSSTNPALAVVNYGSGCRHSTQVSNVTASGSSSMNWRGKTGTIWLYGRTLPRTTFAIASLGFSRTRSGPIPLPFTFPGTETGPSGPCKLLVSLDILTAIGTDANGNATLRFPIPLDPGFHGLVMRGQWLAIDRAIQGPLQFVTSNGVEYNFVKPYTTAPVSRSYNTNTFSQTGTVTKAYGLVTRLN